jgi:hypothetical protein
MKSKKIKYGKIDKNTRIVQIPCIECGRLLNFRIENETVVEGDGVIAVNFPGAVCRDCIDSALSQVSDLPGLICIKEMSPILAKELLRNFSFLLPRSEAIEFFALLFPESGLGEKHIISNL